MARIRTIKPEFWQDEKLAPLDPVTRLVFLGLISQADDAGRLLDNVKLLDGLLFSETDDSCREALDTLARLSRITRYTTESGQRIIQITNWEIHQRVDRPSKHVLPGPDEAALEPVDPQGDIEPSRHPREEVATPSRNPIAPTLDLGPRTMDLGPTTEEQDQNHSAVAASSPGLAHTREEGPPPLAAAADAEVDQEQHVGTMRQLVEAAASELGSDTDRRRLIGELELIVTGDDVTAWRDARGEAVPWPDRPRLLKLSLQRWKLDRDQYPRPRSALLYVIAQQYDPLPTVSISREDEERHYTRHRDGAVRRTDSSPQPIGVDAPAPREEPEQPAQEWARTNPGPYKEILRRVAEAEGLDLDQTLDRIQATGLALAHIRQEVLAS